MVGLSPAGQKTRTEFNKGQSPNYTPSYGRWPLQSAFRMQTDSQPRSGKNAKNQRKIEDRIDRLSIKHEEASPGPSSSASSFSNLYMFLKFTTPSVQLQYLPKSCTWDHSSKRWRPFSVQSIPFFTLRDLWDSFNEWSAYGAGVPLLLKGEESVVQYYVPYLSALQLYSRSDMRSGFNSRKLGEESDASDNDFRDTSSETSSDGEVDGLLNLESALKCCEPNLCSARKSLNSYDFCCKGGSHVNLQTAINEDEVWEDQGHELVFEYFERAAPYSRIPLVDKIAELSHNFPELKTFRSVELLPQSWFSIAWYPIYRIPTGPTLRDLAACFLTFHSLSTPLEGLQNGHLLENKNLCGGQVIVDNKVDKASLQPFGLASYKLRGAFWTSVGSSEREMAAGLQRTAELWLKQQCVQHPDFNFFVSRTVDGRY